MSIGYCKIKTPYFYADGDSIDLYCQISQKKFLVSDLGETLRILTANLNLSHLTEKDKAFIDQILDAHQIQKNKTIFYIENVTILPKAIVKLSLAITKISLYFDKKNRCL